MIVYPNAKINLGLKVLSKRPDSFHNIDSFFLPISLSDVLEVKESEGVGKISRITYSGIEFGNTKSDLIRKAYSLLTQDFSLPSVKIHLHKNIPIGSGLGGGSSDGAYMLKLLNTLFRLNLDNTQLLEYAMNIGSDCSFFILNKFSHVCGTGDKVNPINFSLKPVKMVIIKPNIYCSTKEVFSRYKITGSPQPFSCISPNPEMWSINMANDLEDVVFELHPELKKIKNYLYSIGAIYASMSGSGSSIYGFFENFPILKKHTNYWSWMGEIKLDV